MRCAVSHLQELSIIAQHLLCLCSFMRQRHNILYVLQRFAQVVVHRTEYLDLLVVVYQVGALRAELVYILQQNDKYC